VCSHCPAFENDLVCWQADCICACDVDGGVGSPDAGCTSDVDCPSGGVDTCNVCVSPLNHFVCSGGKCLCACQVVDAG
jgi:hypothetical protein